MLLFFQDDQLLESRIQGSGRHNLKIEAFPDLLSKLSNWVCWIVMDCFFVSSCFHMWTAHCAPGNKTLWSSIVCLRLQSNVQVFECMTRSRSNMFDVRRKTHATSSGPSFHSRSAHVFVAWDGQLDSGT